MPWNSRGPGSAAAVLLCLLIASSASRISLTGAQVLSAAAADHSDYYEEDDVEPVQTQTQAEVDSFQSTPKSSSPAPTGTNRTQPAPPSLLYQAIRNTQPFREGLILACIALYVFSIFRGRRRNRIIATTWAKCFCDHDGVFDHNFAQLGVTVEESTTLLIREGASNFKFYASGRRFCRSLTARLDLRKRQDLLSYLVRLVSPSDDHLDIEVEMNESAMPPMVLAIAAPRTIRNLAKDETYKELEDLAHKVEVSHEKLPAWPTDKLTVLAEHSSNFYDVMPDQVIDQVFGKSAFETQGRFFRSLIFSSERKEGHKHMLKIALTLPPEQHMDELSRWMSAVMTFIDAVGTYKMSAEQKKRAEKARSDLEHQAWKDTEKDRQQAMEDRKEAKRKEEQEKLRKMDPEQREKLQQRKEKLQQKRAMKGKFIRA